MGVNFCPKFVHIFQLTDYQVMDNMFKKPLYVVVLGKNTI